MQWLHRRIISFTQKSVQTHEDLYLAQLQVHVGKHPHTHMYMYIDTYVDTERHLTLVCSSPCTYQFNTLLDKLTHTHRAS